MEIKTTERKRKLIQQFHVKLKRGGMMKQKAAILESYGVGSTKDLTEEELQIAVKSFDEEADKWRKRVMAVIFSWCNEMNYEVDTRKVKRIACRASECARFNDIPTSKLINLYNGWIKKEKTMANVREFKTKLIERLETCN